MKIVFLFGAAPNQEALAHKMHERFVLSGFVRESRAPQKKNVFQILKSAIFSVIFWKINSAWKKMLAYYSNKYSAIENIAHLNTADINSQEVYHFLEKMNPDIILVSGTSLIKQRILSLKPKLGILNLHTGLSPYVKGGPNCTNWCIANNTPHLIGNTVMWINKGIDSGNIITSDIVEISPKESLTEIHIKVMEHAHELYLSALLVAIQAPEKCPSIAQNSIDKGNLYLTKMWGFTERVKLLWHFCGGSFKKKLMDPDTKKKKETLQLVKLPF